MPDSFKAVVSYDLVIGKVCGDVEGHPIPNKLDQVPIHALRWNGEAIVNAHDYTAFYIDQQGIKHIIQHELSWQPLHCQFDEALLHKEGHWCVKNPMDHYLTQRAQVKAQRKQAFMIEADPLKNEYDYDREFNRPEVSQRRERWLMKVAEIKARYPFPAKPEGSEDENRPD
ncbi:hypothetical protein [Zooshikella ganghwensis]|uniref:hypothetical protein n=1 Tax=Zooshikella ganghwensis TaxID=202772 RepID=UPI000411DF02|nr:hypothetical protein [Zooshikella ganghwensis]